MLYQVRVNKVEQDVLCRMLNVRQSNISWRLMTVTQRIQLRFTLWGMLSETTLRKILLTLTAPPHYLPYREVVYALFVAKTCSQRRASEGAATTQIRMRYALDDVLKALSDAIASPATPAPMKQQYQQAENYLLYVTLHYNQLAGIREQFRYSWKLQHSNTLSNGQGIQSNATADLPAPTPPRRRKRRQETPQHPL